tara:strand:+ start:685 stop:1722 length:1038 start_codon:yes stop_codon:yes gene_type:complete
MKKILVTGGGGYIGSHTIVDLINSDFEVVSIDNLSRCDGSAFDGIKLITKKSIKNYKVDICDFNALKRVFKEEGDINGVIHFAAYKSVPESINRPLDYYYNNINSLINILECCELYSVSRFVFSSSCSVYGNVESSPVSENTELGPIECPYAYTKQIGEQLLSDFSKISKTKCIALRYFNPVGAHESHKIGEVPFGPPGNLFPIVMEVAHKQRAELIIHGNDYNTRDGSCIRDFIHVMDIADAHTKALKFLNQAKKKDGLEIINLGTGNGISIMEVIECFNKTIGFPLAHKKGPRRAGDIPMIFANNKKAKEKLNWIPKRSLEQMIYSAYHWTKNCLNTKINDEN